jgi:formylglycine-generating enzyme required for sulfatase activity
MSALDLESLLAALRDAGLRAGVTELLRLREVFARMPDLADPEGKQERLRSMLRAVLVKSLDERTAFDLAFDGWTARAEQEWSALSSVLRSSEVDRGPARRWSRGRRPGRLAAGLALLGLCLALGTDTVWSPSQETVPLSDLSKLGAVSPLAGGSNATLATDLAGEPETVWQGWPPLGLGLLALAAAGGLWLVLRRRSWLPLPEPPPSRKGPPRVFLTPAPFAGLQLLDARQEDTLVWGIGHFVAEEPTRRLNAAATARATAREAGILRLVFHRPRYHRKVWLWVDEAADDPTLPLLAEEVKASLAAHGLPVEQATFHGLPDRLVTAEGAVFAPSEIDDRRDETLVAVLTDGRLLVRQYAADDRRVAIEGLLRNLSHWPHLAFVGFADGAESLRPILARHGLPVLPPAGLVEFLGGRATPPSKAGSVPSLDDAAWAAVCALAPASIPETTALQIRRRLRLATSPWALHGLRAEARAGPSGRLAWKPGDRARRLNELREVEVHPAGSIAPGSLLGRALRLWEDLYDEELRRRTSEPASGEGTPAHQLLRMERALLRLWGDQAGQAVRELYALFQGALREVILEHLPALAPTGRGGPEHVRLPWSWEERSSTERAMLREMNLGGGMPSVRLRWPGRLWLGIGTCLGLALGGLAVAALPCRPGQEVNVRGVAFVRICPGTFTMGSTEDDPQADSDEKPAHQVTLSEFWIGKTEVTNAQYRGLPPSRGSNADLPVTGASWTEAQAFCRTLGGRLPTEAEWEYAARAGTWSSWSFGSDRGQIGQYAWFLGNSGGEPQPVGRKLPNLWGLHDMHGNAWEWVGDWYGLYSQEPRADPQGPSTGDRRVLRGGAFNVAHRGLRSAFRDWDKSGLRVRFIGIRCVRAPASSTPRVDIESGRGRTLSEP